jgi:hypothetical protein
MVGFYASFSRVAKTDRFCRISGRLLTQELLKYFKNRALFQADDEGSIPFTRSNDFKDLASARSAKWTN